ncbi:hypothetical protein [Streptomyces sp. NPDC004330]|uniref:hypothetical protein n=1 Tax=Streptomyces sp. NPDC004330 TaxID=3364700 RepID=UPI00368FE2B0
MLRTELPRVRAAATAWRTGLAVLLAGLFGFGLIQGRTDIGELARPWAVAVGLLLAVALLVGVSGAMCLMRASHGTYRTTPTVGLPARAAADHQEALTSARYLRCGVWCTLLCVLFLAGAVATNWYGPAKESARLVVVTPQETACGTVLRLGDRQARLLTKDGEVTLPLPAGSVIRVADTCP